MTAHRRTRKFKKQGANDDHSYTERYRKASDAAKAARTRLAEADSEVREPRIITQATLRSVSLVKIEDSPYGYSIEVGEAPEPEEDGTAVDPRGYLDLEDVLFQVDLKDYGVGVGVLWVAGWEKDILDAYREELRRGVADEARSIEVAFGDLRADEDLEGLIVRCQEAVREAGSPDAASVVEPGADRSEGDVPAEQGSDPQGAPHQVFFEAEVNGLPTHVGTEDCYCSETQHHWKELGEI